MKALILLLTVAGFGFTIRMRTDWENYGLKGRVKSVISYLPLYINESGSMDTLRRKEFETEFNIYGIMTVSRDYDIYTDSHFYDDNFLTREYRQYAYGKLEEVWNYTYFPDKNDMEIAIKRGRKTKMRYCSDDTIHKIKITKYMHKKSLKAIDTIRYDEEGRELSYRYSIIRKGRIELLLEMSNILDDSGRVTEHSDYKYWNRKKLPSSMLYRYTYVQGKKHHEQVIDINGAVWKMIIYEYDVNGRLNKRTEKYNDGMDRVETYSYTYDRFDNWTAIAHHSHGYLSDIQYRDITYHE